MKSERQWYFHAGTENDMKAWIEVCVCGVSSRQAINAELESDRPVRTPTISQYVEYCSFLYSGWLSVTLGMRLVANRRAKMRFVDISKLTCSELR